MVAQATTRVTFEEYAALPETNQIVELIAGDIVMNPPLFKHQRTLRQILETLFGLRLGGELCIAPTGLHFDDGNSFEPDLFWVSAENKQCFLEPDGRFWHGAPDLVVEILLPSTAFNDRGHKFETYQQYGVREYWLVDPEAKFVEAYVHAQDKFERLGVFKSDQSFVSSVLNNATIPLQTWFSDEN